MALKEKFKVILQSLIDGKTSLDDSLNKLIRLAEEPPEERTLEQRKEEFRAKLISLTLESDQKTYKSPYNKEMLKKFWNHWTELSPNGRKFRFEKQATFDMSRRLATWVTRSKTFSIVGLLQSKQMKK